MGNVKQLLNGGSITTLRSKSNKASKIIHVLKLVVGQWWA